MFVMAHPGPNTAPSLIPRRAKKRTSSNLKPYGAIDAEFLGGEAPVEEEMRDGGGSRGGNGQRAENRLKRHLFLSVAPDARPAFPRLFGQPTYQGHGEIDAHEPVRTCASWAFALGR